MILLNEALRTCWQQVDGERLQDLQNLRFPLQESATIHCAFTGIVGYGFDDVDDVPEGAQVDLVESAAFQRLLQCEEALLGQVGKLL